MGRYNRDVGGYRGRRTITDILKFIAAVLAVLVVVVLGGIFYLQRYVVYTDEGAKLELPPFLQFLRWEREEPEPAESNTPPDLSDVSFTEDPSGSVSEPVSEPEEPAGFALELPVSDVVSGAAAEKLAQAGAQALILEMKDQEGRLAWHSGRAEADRAQVNGSQANSDALAQWNQGEVYTIARVCCFRDNSIPYYYNKLALRVSGGNWRDELGLRWLSPAQEDAQGYIAALCGELAGLGFDEIVLEQFAFPTAGKLDHITRGENYDAAQFTPRLESLLTQIQQAVEPYGTKISLRVGRDTLTGAETSSGVTGALLEGYAFRVWMDEDGLLPPLPDLLEPAGITGGTERLVSIAGARTEGSQLFQAVVP